MKPGVTISLAGRAFLGRCLDCRRLIFANAMTWGADFAGDSPGSREFPVICTTCAKARRRPTDTGRNE
jgi:hypothetical protein